MFLGKAGVMALYAKRKFDQKGKLPHQYLLDHQQKFQSQLKKKNIYSICQYPKGAWFLGLVFVSSGISLLYILLKYDKGDLTLWWRFLIILGMTILGIVFLTSVDRMKYEVHKTHQILLIERMNPFLFCRKITIIKDLEQLEDIRITKKGHKSVEYYTIQFVFKDSKVDTLEYNELRETKLKFTEITTFLEQQKDLGKIKIEQELDPYYEFVNNSTLNNNNNDKNNNNDSQKMNQQELHKVNQQSYYNQENQKSTIEEKYKENDVLL
ncbi:unnamed protein product [Paramecium octaurelia]|uniref:Uncharacterized protein n=1 Tax=Paramecium octaurelia TaxID=43137 RepID=A0A8S1T550_PAROT|nr:unnamed protein product [Paramecium octaurelia]